MLYDTDGITGTEYGGAFAGTDLEGLEAVVWERSAPYPTNTGFGFSSRNAPAIAFWTAPAGSGSNDGSGYTFSAAPEPGTMLLTSLGLLGIAAWRRRKLSE